MGSITVSRAGGPEGEYFEELAACAQSIDSRASRVTAARLARALSVGATVALAGNGGSAATADHMAADLAMCARNAGFSAKVFSLSSSPATITQLANDYGYEEIFCRQVDSLLHQRDLLVVLSVSGNSSNLVLAAEAALAKGAGVIALLGRGGQLARLSNASFIVDNDDYGLVEDIHMAFGHMVSRMLLGRRNTLANTEGAA